VPERLPAGLELIPRERFTLIPVGEIEGRETMVLNMGPQHPSTHGVLRLILELDGESVINVVPDIGYLHTGIEKTAESKTFTKAIPLFDRLDYLATMSNVLAYVLAVEKLMDVEVPPRAQYARVILTELTRIASHLVWLATHALDLAAISVFWYCFRERELLLDIFEMCSGQRMMFSYFRIGGLHRDLPEGFEEAVRSFIDLFPSRLADYENLLRQNPLWLERTIGVGVISPEDAIAWGVTGPSLRGSGVNWDIRKIQPYSSYEDFDFDVPIGQNGDVYDRYLCRMEEMRQSRRIVQQALDRLPDGPYITDDRKVAPPPKEELWTSMEAVIHHFKLWTEGFSAPSGEVYHSIESPRGELGVYVASNGGSRPWRVHFRAPSFVNLQALPAMAKGGLVADLVAVIGSIDIVLGEIDR